MTYTKHRLHRVSRRQARADSTPDATPEMAVPERAVTATSALPPDDSVEHAGFVRDVGARLRAARLAAGLDPLDVAQRLKLPLRVIDKLETGDWAGIDSPLYLRGYLRSLGQLLGVEIELPAAPLQAAAPIPQPVASVGSGRGRRIMQRYTSAAAYLGLTAIVVVLPLIYLSQHHGLRGDLSHLMPLDPVPAAETGDATESGTAGMPAHGEEHTQLRASMAPVALLERELDRSLQPQITAPPAPTREGGFELRLDAPSWVEISDRDGARIEYALLPAGTYRYGVERGLEVRLGNALVAHVEMNGEARDLSSFRRANVAYFRVDRNGAFEPPAG